MGETTEAGVGAAGVMARLSEAANADRHLRRAGRGFHGSFRLGIGDDAFILTVADGRVASIERGPFVMRSWTFGLRAPEAVWIEHWRQPPRPGYHDIFALLRRGDLVLEGDLQPLMAWLLYVKLLLAIPRTMGNAG